MSSAVRRRCVFEPEPFRTGKGKCGLCSGGRVDAKSIDLCAVCIGFAVDLDQSKTEGTPCYVPMDRRPALEALIKAIGREHLEKAAGLMFAAQAIGPTSDPEKLGDAEADRVPFWVSTGERP